MTLRERPTQLTLGLLLLTAAAALLWQGPFAFYSPDVSYHTSRILRSSEGDYFTDPFSGTQTIYPGLFHFLWGQVQRWSGIDAFAVVRWASALNVLGTFAAFYFLAVQALEDRERAAAATLSLGLVLFAPTGRYLLLANPVNLSLLFLFASFGFLWRFLRTDALRDWLAGMLLVSLGVNVAWYQGLAAAGVLLAVLVRLRREGRLSFRILAWGAAALLLPALWTAVHLWTIRPVLPAYLSHRGDLVTWTLDLPILRDWPLTYATHWNLKFLPQMWPSRIATVLFLGIIAPATAALLLLPAVVAFRRRTRPIALPTGSRDLLLAAALVFLSSLIMGMTRDLGRVAWVQFVSFALLLLYAWRVLPAVVAPRINRIASTLAAVGGAACLSYTALHSGQREGGGLTSSTRAVVDFIAALPDHAHTRIFVPESDLRRLTPFVTFTSFVNHRTGRYYSQDPVSSDEMLQAYRSILAHDANTHAALDEYAVELLAFRHRDSRAHEALADSYRAEGSDLALRSRDWTVVRWPNPRVPTHLTSRPDASK